MDLECKIEAYPPPAIRWPSYKLIAKIVWSSRGGGGPGVSKFIGNFGLPSCSGVGNWDVRVLFEYSVPQLVTVTNNQQPHITGGSGRAQLSQ